MTVQTHHPRYTMDEFNALARNGDGDIIHLSDHYMWFTNKQIEDHLTDDDWQRVEELKEEMYILRCEALREID